jgi:hypothetical protein
MDESVNVDLDPEEALKLLLGTVPPESADEDSDEAAADADKDHAA